MKKVVTLFLWLGCFVIVSAYNEDVLKEKCESNVVHSSEEAKELLLAALSAGRNDCITSLLLNPNYDTRTNCVKAMEGMEANEKVILLEMALANNDIWRNPKGSGEDGASFQVALRWYAKRLREVGLDAEASKLTDRDYRLKMAEALKKIFHHANPTRNPSLPNQPTSKAIRLKTITNPVRAIHG